MYYVQIQNKKKRIVFDTLIYVIQSHETSGWSVNFRLNNLPPSNIRHVINQKKKIFYCFTAKALFLLLNPNKSVDKVKIII